MATRFTDDLFNNAEGSDFIVRRRIPLTVQIILVFAFAFAAIYSTAIFMKSSGSATLFLITLTGTIGSLACVCIYFQSRMRDLVLATEFQNALLASAAQLSTRFCLITKVDGSIVYVDTGFQKIFPHFMRSSDRNIDGMMHSAGLSHDVIGKIILTLQQRRNERILLPLATDEGKSMPIIMSIDMLPRPKGYFLLRGRDYVERRADAGIPADTQSDGVKKNRIRLLNLRRRPHFRSSSPLRLWPSRGLMRQARCSNATGL